jgi:hypothetical protein
VTVYPAASATAEEDRSIRHAQGNITGARKDLQPVVQLAPDTSAADSAKHNIARLDAPAATPRAPAAGKR